MSMATIRLYIPSMIRTLNEIRFEQEEYINEHGWYDRNMVGEITDDEIMDAIDSIMIEDGEVFSKGVSYRAIDKIKECTDWYRYRNEDGLFDKSIDI